MTQTTGVVLVSEELSELLRLAGPERLAQWQKVYEVAKSGLEGKEAIETINSELDIANHVDEKSYKSILRAFRERSVLLTVSKDATEQHPLIAKFYIMIDKLMNGIDAEKIKKANVKDSVFASAILLDKIRLLENKSTSNAHLIVNNKNPEALKTATEDMKKLRQDFDIFVDFAKSHGLELPKAEAFRKRMLDSGEMFSYGKNNEIIPPSDDTIVEAEAVPVEEPNAAGA